MSHIEDILRDALTTKAATVADDGLLHPLPTPHRSWSVRWRGPLALAASLAVVASGLFLGVRGVAVEPFPAASPKAMGPYVGPLATPIEQVWPKAVHRIPAEGPGGVAFTPTDVADGAVVGRGQQDTILRYDLTRRAFNVVATVNTYTTSLVAGDGHAAWWAGGAIWLAPLTGGEPVRLATAGTSPTSLTGLAIADGMVTWSTFESGIQSVPLSGGPVARVPGSAGYVLMEWPWAGRAPNGLVDLRSGTWSTAPTPRGRTVWFGCGPEWCADLLEAWRRDGTVVRRLPGRPTSRLWGAHVVHLVQQDAAGTRASTLYDVPSGRAGQIVNEAEGVQLGDEVSWYRTGDTVTAIDMDALR
ncbi:hypothetical protein [Herbidospora mongoliensis]|uniref:hypothetical protein n=1 Tax=Herbidospora mongoliensis TaxID=688067 RepID=UPI0008337BB0|nr:hypothetical protein [Herbidospora mongoliensis]